MKKKDIVKSVYNVLLKTGFKDSYILEIEKDSETLKVDPITPAKRFRTYRDDFAEFKNGTKSK